jgi:hypothetical protein
VDTRKDKPDRVQSIPQPFLFRLAFDKFLYGPQLVFTARLKSARVMENVAFVVCEDEFVVDIVLSPLKAGFSLFAITDNNKPVKPPL